MEREHGQHLGARIELEQPFGASQSLHGDVDVGTSREVAPVKQRTPLPDAQRSELAHDHLHDAIEVRPRRVKVHVQLALPGRLAPLQEGNRFSLLEFYLWYYDWPEPDEAELIELFDRHAVQMKARNEDGSWEYAALGVGVFRELHRIGYAIQLTVPSSKPDGERDRIWAAIIASVRRIEADAASDPAS